MEQKSYWQSFLDKIDLLVPVAIKKYAPELSAALKELSLKVTTKILGNMATKAIGKYILKVIGSTNAYLFLVTTLLKRFWKWAYPNLKKVFYLWDRKDIDNENIKKLEENETNGATSDEKVKDELDFLNGNKS